MPGINYILSQIFGFAAIFIGIISFQFKNMKSILISQLVCNGLSVLMYTLNGGTSGAAICIIAIVQSIVIYIFNVKNKETPVAVSLLFVLLYIIISYVTFNSARDFLSGGAALAFAVSLLQKSSGGYRTFMLSNVGLWIIYDITLSSWVSVIMRCVMLASIISAMIRIDRKKQ